MHAFEIKVDKYIEQNAMLSQGENVVLGVSGGADSTALLFVMLALRNKYGINLKVVHINHKIRPEAEEEARIVRDLCLKNDIEFIYKEYEVEKLAKENKKSCEEMGRELRYEAFRKVLGDTPGKIAVAHNMNDLSETMLFNLFRGTGITGLSSIAPVRDNIIRPLLCVERGEIESYLKDIGVSFCTDKSNFSDDYTRNRIRNNIIPVIKDEVSARATEHMSNTAAQLREINDYIEEKGREAYRNCLIRANSDEVVFTKDGFDNQNPYIRKLMVKLSIDELIPHNKDITSAHIEAVCNLKKDEGYKEVNLPYGLVGFVSYNETGIKKADSDRFSVINYSFEIGDEVKIDGIGKLKSEFVDYAQFTNLQELYTKYLNCDKITQRMSLRTRKDGDYIVVNAKGGRKKINDYFIDLKIPSDKRDEVLLLADGNRIMWVIGYRIGEDCKVTDTSEKIIKITFMEEE